MISVYCVSNTNVCARVYRPVSKTLGALKPLDPLKVSRSDESLDKPRRQTLARLTVPPSTLASDNTPSQFGKERLIILSASTALPNVETVFAKELVELSFIELLTCLTPYEV